MEVHVYTYKGMHKWTTQSRLGYTVKTTKCAQVYQGGKFERPSRTAMIRHTSMDHDKSPSGLLKWGSPKRDICSLGVMVHGSCQIWTVVWTPLSPSPLPPRPSLPIVLWCQTGEISGDSVVLWCQNGETSRIL
jgi:hypothetical protein